MIVTASSSSVPTNWKSQIEQVVRGYETEPARGLIHGLQKDFIQNSWGHRRTNKGADWGMKFELRTNSLGTFLIIEDWGTHGMTGPNMTMSEINKLDTDLDPKYRLARFSAMNYSGGNEGAGLFGRGKTLFSAASSDFYYFFETLTEDEGYRVNWKKLEGNDLRVGQKASEGDLGKEIIIDQTGLNPISRIGSRIIIVNPIPELIDAIKSGVFLKYIEETWWRIFVKYSADIRIIYDNKEVKAKIPSEYQKAISNINYSKWEKRLTFIPNYFQVKKLNLFVSKDNIDEELRGVYVYRKDMKIGQIPLEVPNKIKNKYYGFIEVDEEWESQLALIEDLQHYGFSHKRRACFQRLKNYVNKEHDEFMEDLGLIKRKRNDDQALYNELVEISNDLDVFLDQFQIKSNDGNKSQKETIELKWEGVAFPESNNELITGDVIEDIKFKIKNNSGSLKNVIYKLKVFSQGKEVHLIDEGQIGVSGSKEAVLGPYNLEVKDPLVRYEKNIIVLEASLISAKKLIKKEIPFYYDTTPRTQEGKNIYMNNTSINFPTKDSKRINTGEKVMNIKYEIKNESSEVAYLAFRLSTHNGNEAGNKDLIETTFLKKDIVLQPYEETVIICPDINFSKEIYESEVLAGPIEIRARLIAATDFGNYEMAEIIIKSPPITIFFNQDGNAISQTFNQLHTAIGDDRRSDIVGNEGVWDFYIYKDHPAYERVAYNEDERREYFIEEMLKQTVRLHLMDRNFSVLNLLSKEEEIINIEDMTEADLLNKVYLLTDRLQLQRYQEGRI